jgi:hypothetical protein
MRAFCQIYPNFQTNGNNPVFTVAYISWDGVNAPSSATNINGIVVTIDDNIDTIRAKAVDAVVNALSIDAKDVVLM